MTSTPQHPKWDEFVSACRESVSKAEYLLRGHPELLEAKRSHNKETPLHWLAVENYLEAVAFLIGQGANVNTRGLSQTPLIDAASVGHAEMVSLLLAHGADARAADDIEGTGLHYVARNGHTENLRLAVMLLDAGADPNAANDLGETPLHCAARAGGEAALPIIRLLLERGADPNRLELAGRTPADMAAEEGHHELAAFLRDAASRARER